MNKILLINKINPQDYTEEKKKIFFSIGGMNITSIENKIIDILNNNDIIESNELVLKYNGIELDIHTQQIPQVIKLLSQDNINIYNVFQLYNP